MLFRLSLFIFISFCLLAYAQEAEKSDQDNKVDSITLDLREPVYSDGILTTEKGGVITGPQIRIQATHLQYTKKKIDETPTVMVEATGNLFIEFGEYQFVGEKLIYDFQKQEGVIYYGKTSSGPWFFGGKSIELRSDGSYIIHEGYVTTSERYSPDWEIFSHEVHVSAERDLEAKNVEIWVNKYKILFIPSIKANLDTVFDSPVRYRFKWGGSEGPRFGITYELFAWEHWKTFIRLDYRITRGPGGGIETYYHSPDFTTEFQSINYVARDSSLLSPHEKFRYRFEGIFKKKLANNKVTVLLTYDKISDLDMPSNYYDNNFNLETSKRTQLLVSRREENWIANFYTRVRINNFQTVKQELPTLSMHYRPFVLGNSGVIMDNRAQVSYLDFQYASDLPDVKDYASTRLEYKPSFYCPLEAGPLTFTPELAGVGIFYGTSPQHEERWLAVGIAGATLNTSLYRTTPLAKHLIEPYASFYYYSPPTVSPHDHYIFDINDGWDQLNIATFGIRSSLYKKRNNHVLSRILFSDIYFHAFPKTSHIRPLIPRVYSRFVFFVVPTVRQTLEAAWDVRHNQISHYNTRLEWTLNADFAVSTEYRHRNAFSWRKDNHDSFFLEAFHSENRLRHSQVSDQRDTLLFNFFYRFHPQWSCQFSARHGWNRRHEPPYTEYEIDLFTTIQTAWNLKFSFQRREHDTRFAIYVDIGLKRPEGPSNCAPMNWFE